MQMLDTRTHWPRDFLAALELAGQATARLPFGVPDPVLCGAAAVALYTGGLWPATTLEVTAVDQRKLVAELFALGFRWSRGARTVDLWHPDCEIGIDILPAVAPGSPAEQANQVTVTLDLERSGPSGVTTLKVVGIEDLIIEQVRCWLLDGAPVGENVTRLQALVALARAGVGGPLRASYLQRRLALETKGEVFIDDLTLESDNLRAGMPRSIGLTEMQVRIQAWRAREGLPSDPPGAIGPDSSDDAVLGASERRHEGVGQSGWSRSEPAKIPPFGTPRVVPQAHLWT
jgi:hypothetical protein